MSISSPVLNENEGGTKENYSFLVNKQKAFFRKEQTKNISFRLAALKKLKDAIKVNEQEIMAALKEDLNKSELDAYAAEIGFVLAELTFTIKNLSSWVKVKSVKTPMTHFGSTSYIYSEPYGVALIIAPWNYPFQLAIAPLIGAIAAGNCAVLKPSELTPKTSEVLAKLINGLYPEEYVSVVEGGVETSTALLEEKFDYIFFTGSVPVGKIIMKAAAKHLTPVTLELGGKSPCIVHDDANLKVAAKRVAWGKFTNAGQTCIAPDYLYVHKNVKDKFLSEFKNTIKELYGENPLRNSDFTHIVSERHFKRLEGFLDNGQVYSGGKTNSETLAIEPTVLTNISWDDPIMQDEIFGPILPVMEYSNLSEVVDGIHNHPKPLALYIFSENNQVQQTVLNSVSFGGGCVNDTVYHFVSPHLPFGGVGPSGIGSYHGKGSFDTFSHKKSVLKQTTLFDIPFRYPNFKNGLKMLRMFLK
ncbi:aldehyde dehydrogenase [Neobacillus rhizophilus]|uniref:Aldehyde dehydrogenase n=1 Tax=Neobacillus rhizophilus TaxID=2833579 RepID=A0A942U3V2_9BACI|nr:aldehyde dehydrogenase [Neobacillus rhizophilus]MBS4211084.1 aldehyde dehydrogenase [Neobacillus rhizophilus]